MANQISTVASSQTAAEPKKSLGTGKKDRNTARLLGAGKMDHLTGALGLKQELEIKLW
jgi:hypothetical protein